jgi:hypothetical protein
MLTKNNKNIKLHISIPCLGEIKAETFASFIMWSQRTQLPFTFDIQRQTYIHMARNRAVWEAVDAGATHLMFIDSDINFPSDGIETLLEANKDIIGGIYYGRITPFPVLKIKHPTLENEITNPSHIPDDVDMFQVEGIGTGFLLINMDVFKKLEPPFFFHAKPEDFGLTKKPFPYDEVGEDIAFCLSARKAGIEVWAHNRIELGHVGSSTKTKADFTRWIKEEKERYYEGLKEEEASVMQ